MTAASSLEGFITFQLFPNGCRRRKLLAAIRQHTKLLHPYPLVADSPERERQIAASTAELRAMLDGAGVIIPLPVLDIVFHEKAKTPAKARKK